MIAAAADSEDEDREYAVGDIVVWSSVRWRVEGIDGRFLKLVRCHDGFSLGEAGDERTFDIELLDDR